MSLFFFSAAYQKIIDCQNSSRLMMTEIFAAALPPPPAALPHRSWLHTLFDHNALAVSLIGSKNSLNEFANASVSLNALSARRFRLSRTTAPILGLFIYRDAL